MLHSSSSNQATTATTAPGSAATPAPTTAPNGKAAPSTVAPSRRPGAQPTGVFVTNDFGQPLSSDVLAGDKVAGALVRLTWKQLELGDDQWSWGPLDQAMSVAGAAHKPIILAVAGGGRTPSYVYGRGVAKLDFTIVAHQGNAKGCTDVSMPPPWDPTYLSLVDRLAHRVAAHLADAGQLAQVEQVKISGISQVTEEMRLPVESSAVTAQSGCKASDALVTWQQAGYQPAKVLAGYQAMARSWAAAFPAAALDSAIIPRGAFPDLGSNGPQKGAGTVLLSDMMTWAHTTYGSRFAVSYNAIKPSMGDALATYRALGIPTGYQIAENEFGNPSCPGVQPANGGRPSAGCNSASYQQAIDLGRKLDLVWLEVFENTVRGYPEATGAANSALTAKS